MGAKPLKEHIKDMEVLLGIMLLAIGGLIFMALDSILMSLDSDTRIITEKVIFVVTFIVFFLILR